MTSEILRNEECNPNLLKKKGLELLDAGKTNEAVECFSKGLVYAPFDSLMRFWRGRKLIGREEYTQSASDLKLAALENPEDWECWYYLGVACYLGGMYEEAKVAHANSKTLMKKYGVNALPATTDWYWMICMKLGQPEEAAKALEDITPDMPTEDGDYLLLVHLTPGDPAAAMLGEDATAAEIAALQTQLGLDDPLVVQYFRWVGNCLRLDFGTSTAVVGKPVSEMIASHFQPTILLAIYSQLITILIAIPCGMLAAKKRGTIADYFVSVLSMLGISLPSFLMGLGMVLLFAVNLRVLPAAGYKNPFTDGFLPFLRYMTLPAVSLGFIHAGYMMRMTKASMLEVLGSDYIKMARSKGVREWKIVTKHTFRNALLTVITVVGQGFISALAGAAVVERLFNIPGMGSLMVDSIEKRDYQVIQAITLLIAMLNVFINLIIDLIYGLADPRIRLD